MSQKRKKVKMLKLYKTQVDLTMQKERTLSPGEGSNTQGSVDKENRVSVLVNHRFNAKRHERNRLALTSKLLITPRESML